MAVWVCGEAKGGQTQDKVERNGQEDQDFLGWEEGFRGDAEGNDGHKGQEEKDPGEGFLGVAGQPNEGIHNSGGVPHNEYAYK
ncbi:MAG: hypothetical protein WC777_01100 [Candidatus Gracilibacteria bacterium]